MFLLIGLILFSIVAFFFVRWSIPVCVGDLEEDCYFYEYRHQVIKDMKKKGKKYQDIGCS
jgi:hypothetical protein